MATDLEKIARILTDLRDKVRDRMNATRVVEESDALYLQLLEINHRVMMIDQILFSVGTAAFSADMDAIRETTRDIEKAIDDMERLRDAITGIKNLLGIVDKVIDIVT